MRVRLTRRFAEAMDGIDLSQHRVGDLFDLSPHDAGLLIAEGWATLVTAGHDDEPERRVAAAYGSMRRARRRRR